MESDGVGQEAGTNLDFRIFAKEDWPTLSKLRTDALTSCSALCHVEHQQVTL